VGQGFFAREIENAIQKTSADALVPHNLPENLAAIGRAAGINALRNWLLRCGDSFLCNHFCSPDDTSDNNNNSKTNNKQDKNQITSAGSAKRKVGQNQQSPGQNQQSPGQKQKSPGQQEDEATKSISELFDEIENGGAELQLWSRKDGVI
jgi:hypothetical protein